MWRFNHFIKILSFGVIVLASCSAGKIPPLKAKGYIITSEEDSASEKWAEYLFNHLSKRTKEKNIVTLQKQNAAAHTDYKIIYLAVVPDLKETYCIKHNSEKVELQTKNADVSLWIIYQLIESIAAEDDRFTAVDLPPSEIGFSSHCSTFHFEYREPHFAANLAPDYSAVAGNNNIELDWGLWGHNLKKIMQDVKDEEIFALVNGKRNNNQFNFSSTVLYNTLCEYIIDNYGNGNQKSYRFMIMPNDNNLVCTCGDCDALGNTEGFATPAVSDFIRKLSERFPKHYFYTTAYKTTRVPAQHNMPENAGVFFSTVNLQKGIELNNEQSKTADFVQQINDWKNKTSNMYLWDYAANFDDYLSPLPVFNGLQKQFTFFKSIGIKGIFLNANGYDYAPFDGLKTFVSGALMKNVNADINALCIKYLKKQYPVNHQLIIDYIINAENKYAEKNKAYNMYGSMRESINTYLNAEDFIGFYNALPQAISKASGEEKSKLEKLYTALSFTRLQIAYTQTDYASINNNTATVKPEVKQWLEILKKYTSYSDMQRYKEDGGFLKEYINEWNKLISKNTFTNLLNGSVINVNSTPNEGFEKTNLLTDCTPGFPQDYHQGWYLSSSDLELNFSADKIKETKKLQLRFLSLQDHGIFPPEKTELYANDKLIQTISKAQLKNNNDNSFTATINYTFSSAKNITVKCIRKQEEKSIIACDEIQITK